MHTGLAAGLAPGAAIAGLVVDAADGSTAYLVWPRPVWSPRWPRRRCRATADRAG